MAEHGQRRRARRARRARRPRWSALVGGGRRRSTDLMEADRSFHDLVARASGNRVLAAVSRDIREVIGTLWGFSSLDAERRRARRRAAPADRRRDARARRRAAAGARCATTCVWAAAGRSARPAASRPSFGSRRRRSRVAMGLVVGIDTGGTFTDMVVFDPATGHVDSLKTSSTPATPGQAIVNALDEGGDRGRRARDVHARHDRRHERADRAHRVQGRVRHDDGIRGHALHPAHQPQGALRPALDASRSRSSRAAGSASGSTSGSTPTAPRSGPSTRTRCAALCRHDPRVRAPRRSRVCLLFSYVSTDHEERVKRDPRGGAAGPAGLGLARGGADLARVRALVDHDRRRVPPTAVRPLRRRASTPRCASAGHDARLDDDEVERRRDALRAAAEAPDPDRDVRAGGRHDRDGARRTRRSASRTCSRSTWAARAPTSASWSTASSGTRPSTRSSGALPAAVPLIDIKSIGAGGGSIAWVDAGGFLRVGPRSAGRAPGPICYGRGGTRADGHRREPAARPARPRATSSPAACASTRRRDQDAMEALGEPLGLGAARARGVDRRDREREHGERDQDGLARARPRPPPLRAARLRRRRAAARGGRRARRSASRG